MFVLKPEVGGRATYTYGDSLDSTDCGLQPNLVPSPMVRPSLRASPHGQGYTPPEFHDASDTVQTMAYVEAQVFGGVALSDVERVIYDAHSYSSSPGSQQAFVRDVAPLLDALGIPWVVR